jgi:deoxyribonuclease-4
VLIGAHCSGGIKKGIDRAVEIGADCVQLFVQSPRAWRFPDHDPKDLAACRARREGAGLRGLYVHALYLVNLAGAKFYEQSLDVMRATVDTACAIGADGVVFHVGSHLGSGFEAGLERAVPALGRLLERCSDDTWLLMENSAGAGDTIGRSVDELAALYDALDRHPRLGLCLDSCHLWVSGYDVTRRDVLDALLDDVDARIGLDRLRAVHVNDAAAPLGSNRDRHANVLEGLIGEEMGVFVGHPRLQGLPALLEVPGTDNHGPDAAEIAKLRDLNARWTAGAARAGKRRAAPRARGSRSPAERRP